MSVSRGDVVLVDYPFSTKIGALSASLMQQVDGSLKSALGLP